MRASSSSSSSGAEMSSSRSTAIWWVYSSRALWTDSHSPIAIESAPARSPAKPATRTAAPPPEAPATPIERLRLETSPSLAPRTAARRALPPPIRWRPSMRATVPPAIPRPPESSRRRRACERSSAGMFAVASGCASYIRWSADSFWAMVATTAPAPKRRAIQIKTRVRHEGRRGRAAIPAASSRSRQTAPWRTSVAASRRYSSRRAGSCSAAAITS